MFFIALAVLVLTLVGYFLFYQNPSSQSECSNNVAEQGSDPGSGEVVTGSESTQPVVTAASVPDPGVPVEPQLVASAVEEVPKNVQLCPDAAELEDRLSAGALNPTATATASDTPSLTTTEQLPGPGPVANVPEEEAPSTDLPLEVAVAVPETQAEAVGDDDSSSKQIHTGSSESASTTTTTPLPGANQVLDDLQLSDVKFTVGESSTDDFAAVEELENAIMNDINVDMSAPKNVRNSEHSNSSSGNSHGHHRVNNRVSHSSPSKYPSGKLSSDHSSLTKILENETDGDIVAANSLPESDKPKLKRQETMYESAEVVTFASR